MTTTTATAPPRRWDPVVRLTHWVIVAAILANALITREGSSPHVWVGYALAATLILRLLWGLVGPAEARFTAFPPSPGRALAHIRDIAAGRRTEHASHNPLGALMVYAVWSVLAVIVVTGVVMAATPERHENAEAAPPAISAPLAREQEKQRVIGEAREARERGEAQERGEARERGEAGEEHEEGPLAEVHEAAVNLLYVLIVLHIAGVIFETRRMGSRIVLAMLPLRR